MDKADEWYEEHRYDQLKKASKDELIGATIYNVVILNNEEEWEDKPSIKYLIGHAVRTINDILFDTKNEPWENVSEFAMENYIKDIKEE